LELVDVKKSGVDGALMGVLVILVLSGVVMVFSSSALFADYNYHDSFYFIKKQLFWLSLGALAFIFCRNYPYENYRKYAKPMLFISGFLLLLTFVPHLGRSVNHAKRWIGVSFFNIEPSEILKLCFIIYMADSVAKRQDLIKNFKKGMVPYLVIIGILSFVLLRQPDFGSAVMICLLCMAIFFVGGGKPAHIGAFFLLCVPAAYYFLIVKSAYRNNRLLGFLDPWGDPSNKTYQIVQSFVAFGSGGISGTGLGKGVQKLLHLPEAHTDFIFAIIGEELGLIGATILLGLFCFFIYKGIQTAIKTENLFGRLLAVGITGYIGLQAFLNMSVVLGMAPTKGMTLPFISYGGSSLIINLAAAGILMNIASRVKNEKSRYN